MNSKWRANSPSLVFVKIFFELGTLENERVMKEKKNQPSISNKILALYIFKTMKSISPMSIERRYKT